jgi:2-iminobutanoate/2-iminopropanoate deaminase
VYLAGQIGIEPNSGELVSADVADQTERIFLSAATILEAAGSSLHHVIKVTIFMVDLAEWGAMNAVYQRFFAGHAPPKSTVEVSSLALGARVEIEFTAELST